MVRYILSILLGVCFVASAFADTGSKIITGTVRDDAKQPLIGATVVLLADGKAVTGTATDQKGKFRFTIRDAYAVLALKVSSIGYVDHERTLSLQDSVTNVEVECAPQSVEITGITVLPDRELKLDRLSIPSEQIAKLSAHSLVLTNPIAAIQHPQINKVGSTHSSQLRVNGTSPNYYLNGISIGSDPSHYGMFSVIPGSIVEQIEFQPQGTDASYGLPSIINLKSASSFDDASHQELDLSTIEATASMRKSNEKVFVVGAVRKSILDALVNSFDISTERQTIPPTSFSDIYLSTGLKVSSTYQVALDQYHAYDYLAFNTATSTGAASSVQTYQRARENYVGLRLKAIYSDLLLDATVAVRDGKRSYQALPDAKPAKTGVYIYLSESQRTYLATFSANTEFAGIDFKAGSQTEYVANRSTDLAQMNWNFLPPFTTSDNPYIYQNALNKTYMTYQGDMSQLSNAAYITADRSCGPVSVTGGLRSAFYDHLAGDAPLLVRLSASLQVGDNSSTSLFYGTFSEDPITAVLEPYQVLIREYAGQLRPISTQLLSFNYAYGPCKLDLFTKNISDMPVVAPDFDRPYIDGRLNDNFLRMRSEGAARFYGGSLACDLKQFLVPGLSFYGSYAYTHGTKTEHDVTYMYETNAPHRLLTQFEYTLSRKISLGSDLQMRSGYHYSPTRSVLAYSEGSVYNETYYQKMLGRENSLQFDANMAVNFYATFDFGNTSLHLAVTNVTNRSNPIIKSPSGYIYDAGILPSLGFRWEF